MKVAQWATGMVGARSLRHLLGRSDMDLVAVKVNDPAKAGVDAGDLCGMPATGVRAVASLDEVVDSGAQCVIHTSLVHDVVTMYDDISSLLAAGINVVSSAASEAMHPPSMEPGLREMVDAACSAGGSTLRAVGLSPGFANDVLPIVMSGVCDSVRHVLLREYVDMAHYESEPITDLLGWGKPATYELPTTFRRTLDAAFEAPLRVVAACLGAEIDKIMTTTERAVASTTFPIATTVVEEGTIAGWRFVFEGRSRESAVVTIDTAWHLHDEWGIGAGWPVGEGWDLTIDAQPELRLRWEVGPATGARSRSPHLMDAAAAHLVNSVPVVVQAPPGIMTPADLRVAAGRWAHG